MLLGKTIFIIVVIGKGIIDLRSQFISNDDSTQQISIRIKNKKQFVCNVKQGLFDRLGILKTMVEQIFNASTKL